MPNRKYDIPYEYGSPKYQREWRRLSGYSEKEKARWREIRLVVFRHYSGGDPKCACCGERQYEFLSIDHIDGGGNHHRKQIGRGWPLTLWIVKNDFPPGFQVLCHNCNQAKGFYGKCPHQQAREL